MNRWLYLLATFATIVIWSCAPISPSYVTTAGADNIRHDGNDYKLAVIEFGELGSYADPFRHELQNTVQLLEKADRPLLVVYIHGWLNNATSDDVGSFQGFLSRLAQSKQVQTHHYNVFGVYFAWPGKSLEIPYLAYLSFWNRKGAAERIASNGDCIDAIEQLSYVARRRPYNYVFLIGHSFGGLILERTVEHTLRSLQGLQNVKPPWDLALMLNPASDSVLTRQLVGNLQSLYGYSEKPVPGDVLQWGGHSIRSAAPAVRSRKISLPLSSCNPRMIVPPVKFSRSGPRPALSLTVIGAGTKLKPRHRIKLYRNVSSF
jgi:pimeloyl-ACP methyl ester carboxylesterase